MPMPFTVSKLVSLEFSSRVQQTSGGVMKLDIASFSVCVCVCVCISVCSNSFTHAKLILAAAQFRVEHVVNCRTPLNRRLQVCGKEREIFQLGRRPMSRAVVPVARRDLPSVTLVGSCGSRLPTLGTSTLFPLPSGQSMQ